MYKLIAIDLDGTLLGHDKRIAQADIDSVRYAVDRGVNVVICSGRVFAGAKIFARQLNINGPVIACNGAIIKDLKTEEVLYSKPLDMEDCIGIIKICKEAGLYFHFYSGDTLYTESLKLSSLFYSERNKELKEDERIRIEVVDDAIGTLKASDTMPYKIIAISQDKELLLQTRKRIDSIQSIETTSSNFDNFEAQKKGVNKGEALKYLADRLGIKREEIIAIGDNENDCSMIKFAGLGVAMGNAEESIKKIAGYVTGTNDECGVAEVIKNFV